MAEELAKKKRIRAGHKASATSMMNRVDVLVAEVTPDSPPDVAKLSQLKLSLQEKLDTLRLLDGDILGLTEEDDLEGEIERADTYKEGVYEAMVKIDKHCATPPTRPVTPPADAAREPAHAVRGNRVKLPKLTLQPFNGDITTWMTFWDSYESSIHKNEQLSNIDKFNYLRSLLEHNAREALAGLTLMAANYDEAIAILKKRFGSKHLIISRHMDILLGLEPVVSANNLRGLRHLYDRVESHVRSLKSLGVAPESYGSLLSPVLLNKLPQELKLIVSRKVSDEDWSLDALMAVVAEEVEARERTTPATSNPSQPAKKPSRDQPTAATLFTGNSSPSCCYCQQTHLSSACKVVTQVEARKQILRKAGRCFNCLRRGHLGRECRSTSKCTKCGRRRICMKEVGSSSTPPSADAPTEPAVKNPSTTTTPKPGLNPAAATYKAKPTTSLFVDSNKTVLLQTARALVYNPCMPQASLEVRIILDSGSQRSYVTTRVKNALTLTPEGEQCMSHVHCHFWIKQAGPQVL